MAPPDDSSRHLAVSIDVDVDGAAVLAWQNLTVTARNGRLLLDNATGVVAGGLAAVMGPSGSGKTTLLNALALRLDRHVRVTGVQRLNGRPYSPALLKLVSGYVLQDDLLNGQLTVEETLTYGARLRCPPSFDNAQRRQRVEEAMADMGLSHAAGVIVGDALHKGISGGERKRLCVALELITQPHLLFLDEPTSGLDSVTARGLVSMLKRLSALGCSGSAHGAVGASSGRQLMELGVPANGGGGSGASGGGGGCTIMCTIHQPQSAIFFLFDHLFLLQSGSIVYNGPASGAVEHFAQLGFPCPAYNNPADFFLDLITVRTNPQRSNSRLEPVTAQEMLPDPAQLRAYYKHMQVDISRGAHVPMMVRELVPWHRQFRVLLSRAMKESARKTGVIYTQLAQAVIIAFLIGLVFYKIGTTQSSVVRRQPVLFFCVINQGIFAALVVINSFPSERLLVLRERAAGTYYASAYFMAKVVAEQVFQLPIPLIFSAIVYFLVGLQPAASKFFVFATFMLLTNWAATSLALMVSTWCRGVDLAISVLPMALEICRLYGGFFLSPANLPTYFVWLDALSYVKYAYVGISLNELTGLELTCTPQQLAAAGGTCPITSGQQTITQLGLQKYSVPLCAGVLVAFVVVCRFLAYVGLRVMKS